ncbi:Fungal Zn2-Cys6 binuclear cluster domain-containing protein [Cladophialophora immunda]|nr:Fungal Zn2-Cys6 binuclear cluster domain-containing protein [Cladophialophora immunda]
MSRELAPPPDTDLENALRPSTSRKKVSLACLACRRRRTKCDGGVPCASCLSRNTECVKDEYDDGRRKLAVKRRLESLEKDRHLLDALLNALGTGGPNQLHALISLIRSSAGRQELASFLENGFGGIGEVGVQNHRHETSSPTYRRHRARLGRIQDIVNPPISVPANPWTTVTDDDDFVSHLMSLWFTWAHPWWHWVDEALFLEAMRSGDTSSLICTPYLVNMILADACLLDTLEEDGTDPNMVIREHFYNEARRGLDAQEGEVSLAMVATLGVQWTYLNINGQDKLGNGFLYQQIFLSKSLNKWRQRIAQRSSMTPEFLAKIDFCLCQLEWTLYALNPLIGLALKQVRVFDRPSRPKPTSHSVGCAQHQPVCWTPYPIPYTSVEWHPTCHYLAFISLAEKATLDETLFEEKQQSDSEVAKDKFAKVYHEVEDWPAHLPGCMKLHDRAMPHVIALHALHSWVNVTISKQTAALDAGHSSRPSLAETPQSSAQSHWMEVCIAASKNISNLLEQIRLNWGADHFPVIIMQPATIAAFTLLEQLNDRPESQEAFFKLCVILRAASRRFRVSRGVLRLLRHKVKENGVVLSDECYRLLADYDTRMDVDQKVRATMDNIGLEYLLEKWDDLDLDEV